MIIVFVDSIFKVEIQVISILKLALKFYLTNLIFLKALMNPSILALGSAVPPYAYNQDQIAEKFIHTFNLNDEKAKDLKQLYQNSAIKTRYSVIPDFKKERDEWHFWGSDYPMQVPGMLERNTLYKKEAIQLAEKSAAQAISNWGGDPASLTHIISVSCTGVVAPGIEFELIRALGLNWSIVRLGINFMGCYGAFKGLLVAQSFAKENPEHRILVVCTELCSLHLQAGEDMNTLLANSLFSDGSAAIIVGQEPRQYEKPLWSIDRQCSLGLENSLDKMTWKAGNNGFFMTLSPYVPALIKRHIHSLTDRLLGNLMPSDCDWAIHPGGKSIIQAIERALKLTPEQTQASWDTLSDYGNMSSATFIFVLEKLTKLRSDKKWTSGIAFGPGLSIEGLLLKKEMHHENE